MKKGIKKAITSPTKETVITDHKRPIHGFCYTHFNMEYKKDAQFSLTLKEIEEINAMSDKPIFEIDDEKKTFKTIKGESYDHWLDENKENVTPLSEFDRLFLSVLPEGRENAVKLSEISKILHTGKHRVSVVVAKLRIAGYLVGSSKNYPYGVYIIKTASEYWETVNTIKKNIRSQQKTFDALMKHEKRFMSKKHE